MTSVSFSSVAFGAVLALSVGAQTPDVLIPSGSLDGIYRLVDRDNDGDYHSNGEAYDYVLHGQNTSVRNIVWVIGSPSRLYYTSTVTEQILSAWDSNGDGYIDVATEETVALDFIAHFGGLHEVNGIAHNGSGVFYVTNDDGDFEGIHRCQDGNADGDFADPGETTAALVEPVVVNIANAPNSGNPALSLAALDSIYYDPTRGANGRYLIEEETFDCTIAVEDMNGDGDFADPGEAYLFCHLWNGGTLGADVHPDVANGILPSSNEIREHAVDPSTNPPTYYLVSIDTNAGGPDNAIVYSAQDGNNDGDVNDTGEVKIFWDGSLDSGGATTGFNFCYGITIWNGQVYITAEFDRATDHERFVTLTDNNNDGDANDPGETVSVWSLPQDRTHYDPIVIPAGVMPPAPAGIPGTYRYFGNATCATANGFHNVQVGSDNWNDKVTIGNAGFMMRTWGGASTAIGVYVVGAIQTNIPLNPPGPTCFAYTSPLVNIPFVTDAAGASNDPIPIPNSPALIGGFLVWQSALIDAASSIGFTTSDGAWMRIGNVAYSYSIH